MRNIARIHKAESRPVGDLKTHSPLPTRQLQQIDPFIFLNHHGPQTYPENNNGLPFGPHPHRGIETVTFIISGDIAHQDTSGAKSVIDAGGIQWMTAGSGLIHAELSSDHFLKHGGDLEILQLWINLPAKHKMTRPFYKGIQQEEMVKVSPAEGVDMDLIAGTWQGRSGGIEPLEDIFLSTVRFKKEASLSLEVPLDRNLFFYIVKGALEVNGKGIPEFHLVEFHNDHPELEIRANGNSILIFGHARPLKEPMVAHGPFVMNTEEEIAQAYQDFRDGKMGVWG